MSEQWELHAAPCETMIKNVLNELGIPAVNFKENTFQITGGLSGALVLAVLEPSSPLVVKINLATSIREELDNYKRINHSNTTASRSAFLSKLKYPCTDRAPEDCLGDDDQYYSILAYDYAGGDTTNRPQTFDKFFSKNAAPDHSFFKFILEQLVGLLGCHFYVEQDDSARKVRPLYLSRIPWNEFLPIASTVAGIDEEWLEFVKGLPEAWHEKVRDEQIVWDYSYRLCHGDLRCANLLITGKNHDHKLTLIDYGSVQFGIPLMEIARLEADLLYRIVALSPDSLQILHEATSTDGLIPKPWKKASDEGEEGWRHCLCLVREAAKKLATQYVNSNPGIDDAMVAHTYRNFLFGNAVRFARTDNPELRGHSGRLDYMWFVLTFARRILDQDMLLPPCHAQSHGVIKVGEYGDTLIKEFSKKALADAVLVDTNNTIEIGLSGHSLWGNLCPSNCPDKIELKDLPGHSSTIQQLLLKGQIFEAIRKQQEIGQKIKLRLNVLFLHPHSAQAVAVFQAQRGDAGEAGRNAREDIKKSLYVLRTLWEHQQSISQEERWIEIEKVRVLPISQWMKFAMIRVGNHSLIARYPCQQLLRKARAVWTRKQSSSSDLFNEYLNQFQSSLDLVDTGEVDLHPRQFGMVALDEFERELENAIGG